MKCLSTRSIGLWVILLLATARPAVADTIVLDGDDVVDWARVFSSGTWKQKDACLHPNALIKFDLSQVLDPVNVISARLCFFVEATDPEVALEFWHVDDDSWTYALREPLELWDWPVADLIGTQVFPDTMSFALDVTSQIIEEGMDGSFSSRPFSKRSRLECTSLAAL